MLFALGEFVQCSSVDFMEDVATVRGQALGQNADVILCNLAKQSILSFPVGLTKQKESEKKR